MTDFFIIFPFEIFLYSVRGENISELPSYTFVKQGSPGGSGGKEPACQCRRRIVDPLIGRSPGGAHGYPLEKSMDRGACSRL